MKTIKRHRVLLSILFTTGCIVVFAHWPAFTSPYIVNNDVRQHLYWMQRFSDPELFNNDLLSEYAQHYVPWGVQAIYAAAAPFINPLTFGKILTVLLFAASAGWLFLLTKRLSDETTALLTVCVFCFFGFFLGRISGGLSRAFVFPMMLLYLLFLSQGRLLGASVTLMLQAVLNPYLFLICATTHILFLLHRFFPVINPYHQGHSFDKINAAVRPMRLSRFIAVQLPIAVGVLLMATKHLFFSNPLFGELVGLADMVGHPEYGNLGRYEILPVPSVFFELLRPWVLNLPENIFAISAYTVGVLLMLAICIAGISRSTWQLPSIPLPLFGYFLGASILLHFASKLTLFSLFLPRRYMEFSFTIFYCIVIGILFGSAVKALGIKKFVPLLVTIFMLLAVVRLQGVELDDYTRHQAVYRFLQQTSKSSLVAGHPELMDNVVTFSQRKAYVTYELSHPWAKRYWAIVKSRTFSFFDAYYGEDPETVRAFCRKNGIDFLIVREEDFQQNRIDSGKVYFEPFGSYIRQAAVAGKKFCLLDEHEFPPVFRRDDIRILSVTEKNSKPFL